MKKLTVFTLATIFVLQHLLVLVLFASFEANRDYIAEVLCINKEDPQSDCDGQCFFMQKLQESNNTPEHQTLLEKNGVEYIEQHAGVFAVVSPEIFPCISLGTGKNPIYSFDLNNSLERPPAA